MSKSHRPGMRIPNSLGRIHTEREGGMDGRGVDRRGRCGGLGFLFNGFGMYEGVQGNG